MLEALIKYGFYEFILISYMSRGQLKSKQRDYISNILFRQLIPKSIRTHDQVSVSFL